MPGPGRLSGDEKERVDSARDAAFEQLDQELSAPIPDVLRHQLGLPDAARAQRELLSRAAPDRVVILGSRRTLKRWPPTAASQDPAAIATFGRPIHLNG